MSTDLIRIMCPSLICRKILAVPTSARGKTVRCQGCGSNIRVPRDKSKNAETLPASRPAKKRKKAG